MDDKDKELYAEENRQALIDLNKSIKELTGLVKEQNSKYVAPKDEVEVTGSVEVNTEPSVDVENLDEITNALETLGDDITEAIANNSYKPIKSVTVKNITEAIPSEIRINNLKDIAKYFTTLGELIKDNQPIVNVSKQELILPTSPTKPISVRLSDGKQFINTLVTAMGGGGLSKLAQANLEALKFNAGGELKTDANINMATEGIATETTLQLAQTIFANFEQKSLAVTQSSGSVSFTQPVDSAHIQNTGTNACYINFGATATTSHYKLMPGDSFPAPVQFTALHAICDTGLTTTLRLIGYF